jgi:hypothetical protein
MPNRRWAVIDSNVLKVADGDTPQANDACVEKCIDVLLEVRHAASLALDDGGEILAEYLHERDFSGQPGVGDEFFRWAFDNQYTSCHRILLTPHEARVYQEFPDTPGLEKFDPSDRKWIATALGCDPTATIYNAVDSDYAEVAQALADAAIPITELCPDCLKHKYRPR